MEATTAKEIIRQQEVVGRMLLIAAKVSNSLESFNFIYIMFMSAYVTFYDFSLN